MGALTPGLLKDLWPGGLNPGSLSVWGSGSQCVGLEPFQNCFYTNNKVIFVCVCVILPQGLSGVFQRLRV